MTCFRKTQSTRQEDKEQIMSQESLRTGGCKHFSSECSSTIQYQHTQENTSVGSGPGPSSTNACSRLLNRSSVLRANTTECGNRRQTLMGLKVNGR